MCFNFLFSTYLNLAQFDFKIIAAFFAVVQDHMHFALALVLGLILGVVLAYALIEGLIKKVKEPLATGSQKQLIALINTIDGIVWEGNPHDDTCTFVSDKVYDVLGYSKKEWMETPNFWYHHLHPEDRDSVSENLNQAIKDRHTVDFEYRMITKYRSVVWIRDIITVINEPNQPTKLRGIMIDITSKKADEAALQRSLDLLSNQNKRLLNFSYIVSHNLRSHAVNIQGISALIETAESDEERNEMITLLKTLGNDLNETLLNLSQIVNVQANIDIVVEPLNLYDYIAKSLIVQNPQILIKKAEVIVDVDKEVLVNYNSSYLESILLYFIANALRCSHPDRNPIITLTTFYDNDQLVLSIADNGIGIDLNKYQDKDFSSITNFELNYTKGFGSFITKNQVESMGGKIELSTELGKGTTFKIYFK